MRVFRLAFCFSLLCCWSLAEGAGKDPRAIAPEAVQAYQKGLELKRGKRYDDSARSLLQAISVSRHYAEAHWALAWVAELKGDLTITLEAFRNAVNHDVTGTLSGPSSSQLRARGGEVPCQVWRMEADGSEATCLGLPCLPAQSKNRELAFTWKYEDMEYPDLWLATEHGEVVRNLTNSPRVWERGFTWSPDGQWIAFSWQRSSQDFGLAMININTGERQAILDGHYTDMPSFSPDGEMITFQEDYQIWVIKVDGSGLRALTPYGQKARNPRFNHKGDQIYFDYRTSGTWGIRSMPVAGGVSNSLVSSAGHDFAPELSPDGLSILFTSTRALLRTSNVWVMNLEAREVQRLTSAPQSQGPAVWSADGTQIYYYQQVP